VRRHFADGSILLGAVRLPNITFKANAVTEVTTDILSLQDHSREMLTRSESWTDLTSLIRQMVRFGLTSTLPGTRR
jgi:hypothetical protein